ncbi:hypothetical protein C4D60_Mb10t08470 [Musa balbisiana]|uniref:Uncharacterized protein n=1 Tax=Musa balbisiana TaxID=52838 RepID=A0A4S8IVK4_MUSBA|nr:hypothetical protein C4D60_Mb10t08470 [Musa balbisiana]
MISDHITFDGQPRRCRSSNKARRTTDDATGVTRSVLPAAKTPTRATHQNWI